MPSTNGHRVRPQARRWVSVAALITQELEDSIWKPNGRPRPRSEVEGLMEQEFTTPEPEED